MTWYLRCLASLMMITVGLQVILACQSEDPVARPYAYARAILPIVQPAQYNRTCLPLSFEYNSAATPVCVDPDEATPNARNSTVNGSKWLNLAYPDLRAQWHLSYHPIVGVRYEDGRRVQRDDALAVLMAETQRMTFKHALKATAIDEELINHPEHKVYGNLYVDGGDAASQVQFYATDSVRHYLRGSLYFAASPNSDSLAPYSAYLLKDIRRVLETLRW